MADSAPAKNNPADFLKTVLGRPVVVKLNSGVDYRGTSRLIVHAARRRAMSLHRWRHDNSLPHTLLRLPGFTGVLACLDGYMNIAMEQTEEYVNGQLKAKYGDTFIRGNNVLYISAQKR